MSSLELGLKAAAPPPTARARLTHACHLLVVGLAGLLLGAALDAHFLANHGDCDSSSAPNGMDRQAGDIQPVPHGAESVAWDPASFDSSVLFAHEVPEFTDPALMARVEAIREGYAHEMHLPHTSRIKLADAMPQASNGVAFFVGGELEKRHGTSTEILFRQESNFLFLSGFDHEEALLVVGLRQATRNKHMAAALAPGDGWLFIDQGDPVWGGGWLGTLEECAQTYDVQQCFWLDDLAQTMADLAPSEVHTVSGLTLPPGALPAGATQIESVGSAVQAARTVKTDAELEVMRVAAAIAVEEHKATMMYVRCGNYESDAESLFRYVAHNYGARHQAYLPIVGSGPASALLHYNENSAEMAEGSIVLIDASAELGATRVGGGYASDITRTWPCSGTFSDKQRGVHDVVNSAVEAGIANAVAGSSFTVASRAASEAILAGLLALGLLQGGTVAEMYDARIHSLFMPHSLGHSIGVDVHDGGNLSPFAPGMCITIEPGVYFYPTLLRPAFQDPVQGPFLNQELLEQEYMDFGGIRLEDVVVITEGGGPPENLVSPALARSAADIEALMAQGEREMAKLGNLGPNGTWVIRPHAAPPPRDEAYFGGDSVI